MPEDLNEDLFTHYKDALIKGAGKGLKTDLGAIRHDDPDRSAYESMRESIYQFAGAKTFSQLSELNNMLYDDQGGRVSKAVFKANANKYYRDAGIIDKKYYDWLNVEYDQAQQTGDMARQWKDAMANTDVLNLQYQTAGDDRVRPAHALLNGIIKPKDDAFWKTNYPPNGWLCRCDAVETNDKATTREVDFQPDPGFGFNPGITNKIFGEHPYFPTNIKAKKRLDKAVNKITNAETQ